jgi:anti-anti-sigma factor
MELAVQLEGTRLGIRIAGNIDRLHIDKLRQYLCDLRPYDKVDLDLAEVKFIDTAFINLLVELKNSTASAVRKIRLLNPDENISSLLQLCQLDKLYAVN